MTIEELKQTLNDAAQQPGGLSSGKLLEALDSFDRDNALLNGMITRLEGLHFARQQAE